MKNILLTDDISNFSASGKRRTHQLRNLAANLSHTLNAYLHFLYVEDLPNNLRKKKLLGPLEKRSPQLISALHKDLKSLHSDTEIHIDSGYPTERILKWVNKIKPELIIIGTRGMRGLGKFFLGSTAEEVVRHSFCPVIVVGPLAKKIGFASKGKKNRILLLTDLTKASKPAEDFALEIAKLTNSKVTIFHSVGDLTKHIKDAFYQNRIPIYSVDDYIAEMKTQARTEISKKAEQFKVRGLSVQTQLVTEERDVTKDIKRELEKNYDLLVMGTHSRNRLLTSFLGSTARNACLFSSVPVAIVRSR